MVNTPLRDGGFLSVQLRSWVLLFRTSCLWPLGLSLRDRCSNQHKFVAKGHSSAFIGLRLVISVEVSFCPLVFRPTLCPCGQSFLRPAIAWSLERKRTNVAVPSSLWLGHSFNTYERHKQFTTCSPTRRILRVCAPKGAHPPNKTS